MAAGPAAGVAAGLVTALVVTLAGCGAITGGQGTVPGPDARAASPATDGTDGTRLDGSGATALPTPRPGALAAAVPTGDPAGGARGGEPGDPADAGGSGRRVAAARASGPGAGTSWSQALRERGKPDVAAVLKKAPAKGTVTLVTIKDVDGRPVISTTVAKDRSSAAGTVQDQLAAPDVLDVSVSSKVAVLAGVTATGPDPYATQWALTKLDAAKAWTTQSGTGITVAVVDTGVYGSHPDLAGVVLPGKDYITAGGNGWADGHGHGTHVAGIVAALANNGIGSAGLAQGVKILPVRALDNQGVGSDADVASGIVWAADSGARVINLSIGAPDYSTAEAAAISYATQRGALVVAAAGNQRDQGNETSYPGAFPNVLAVAATDSSDKTLSFSNTGPYVDLSAPGAAIVSTWPPSGCAGGTPCYQSEWGTSMATPFVSATAALVRAAAPALTPAQVTTVLEQSAKDLETAGRDDASGYGLVQPVAAILAARRLIASASPTASPSASPSGTPSPSPSLPPSAFSLVSATARVGYKGTASATFALTSAGKPVAGAAVTVCFALAGAASPTCSARTTDAAGKVSASQSLSRNALAYARFAGSATIAATTSSNVAITMLPSLQTVVAADSLSVTVNPVSAYATLTLQRLNGTTWTTVTSRSMPWTGRTTFTKLAAGSYRVSISASPMHGAAAGSAVKVG